MYSELLKTIHTVLAENGETRTLRILNMVNTINYGIRVSEPLVFELKTVICCIKIPIVPAENDIIRIDWGNGDTDSFTSVNLLAHPTTKNAEHRDNIDNTVLGSEVFPIKHPSKRYQEQGTYRIKIYGKVENGKGPFYGWISEITKLITLGEIGITDLTNIFYLGGFTGVISPNWDLSKVTKMNRMFAYSRFSGKIPLNWDVSNVLEMKGMFEGCNSFKQQLNWEFHPDVRNEDMFKYTDREGEETRLRISAKKHRIIGGIIKYSIFVFCGIILSKLCFGIKTT